MLEILYDIDTLEVRATNADMSVTGNLIPKEGQEVVIFDVGPPTFESDWYKVDLVNQTIAGNPDYVPFKPRDLKAEIDELKLKVEKLEKKT